MITTLPTPHEAKDQAKRLRRALADRGFERTHAQTLDLIAAAHGARDWNTLAALVRDSGPDTKPYGGVVPILRMFDWTSARAFYLDFLGWTMDGEHHFDDHAPRYVRLRGPNGSRVHLSEHHGDGTPGSAILVVVQYVVGIHAELLGRDYGYAKPGLDDTTLGLTVTLHDPSGNRITFLQPTAPRSGLAAERVPDELPPIVNEVQVTDDPDAAFARFTSFSWWRDYGLVVCRA